MPRAVNPKILQKRRAWGDGGPVRRLSSPHNSRRGTVEPIGDLARTFGAGLGGFGDGVRCQQARAC